jgi:DNA topoisomerase-1
METETVLTHRQYISLHKDHERTAALINLVYVNNASAGIARMETKTGYSYSLGNKKIGDDETLARIKKLAIPPSWRDVWIAADEAAHIQATGLDLNGRKQYRYHQNWNKLRNDTKFHRLMEFGKSLPSLRRRIQKDISKPELSAEKVIATAIRLMEETAIRIGSCGYEKLYGSYGLTTLKDNHVVIKREVADLVFTGKKGVKHRVSLKNKKLVRIIRQCRDVPGKELFQFYDKEGNTRSIDSGMVNSYIKDATGGDFSAKDFRTWIASVEALESFCAVGDAETVTEAKKKIVEVLDKVSKKLGNTRTVCRKYYVHPLLIRLYEENKLLPYISKVNCNDAVSESGLSKNERVLMRILKYFK